MSHTNAEREVHVTARERAHPSLRVLARACIALARHELATQKQTSSAGTGDVRKEAHHD